MLRTTINYLVAMIIQLLLYSCSPPTEHKEISTPENKKVVLNEVLAMATSHGADVEWMRILGKVDLYTIELQQALLPLETPRLLIAPIVDVIQLGDAYILTLQDSTAYSSSIYYKLRCSLAQTKYVLNRGNNLPRIFQDYAVVMRPHSVQRPLTKFECENDGDDTYITDAASDIILVTGDCIDLLFLEDSLLTAMDLTGPVR